MNKRENPQRRSTKFKIIALAATFAVLFCSFQTNAYPLHNGEYAFWPEMPTAAQVLTDMKGKNDLDTAARQHAAFVLLIALVNVAADGTGQIPWPERERELNGAYYHALPNLNGHRDEILAESLQLQADPSFVQPFLKRYFTEAALDEIKPMVASFEAGAQRQVKADNVQRKAEEADAQRETAEVNALKQTAAASAPLQNGLTASDMKTVNKVKYDYLALCAIFTVIWLARIFQLFSMPFRTTSDDPPRFEGQWKSLKVHSFTGHVRGSGTRGDAPVTNSFRLVNSRNKREQDFKLGNWDVPLWEDQLVSVAWAIRKGQTNGPYFIVVNHTTGGQSIKEDVVLQFARQSSLLWTLISMPSVLFPPVWLLWIVRGVILDKKVSQFMSSGVQPLVQALNWKAKDIS
jgi:hypothetical protein